MFGHERSGGDLRFRNPTLIQRSADFYTNYFVRIFHLTLATSLQYIPTSISAIQVDPTAI
jgi:hypothetical protein